MSFLSYPPPRYGGTNGLINSSFRPADTEPDLISAGHDAGVTGASRSQRTHYLATALSTGGEFGLYRIDMPARGTGPTTHFHRTSRSPSSSCPARSGSSTARSGSTALLATSSTSPSAACTPSTTPPT